MRRLLPSLALLALVVGMVAAAPAPVGSAAAGPAGSAPAQQGDAPQGGAQDDTTDDTTDETGVPTQDIIPEPDSGRAPTEAGDRGGALQIAVLSLIVAAVGGIAAKVVHDSRRARDRTSSRTA